MRQALALLAVAALISCGDTDKKSDCPAGYTYCTDRCVDLLTNTASCGSCGHGCKAGESCVSGVCELVCPVGLTVCNGSCVDTRSSAAACGDCTTACAAGEVCANGQCTGAGCAAPLQTCGAACTNTSYDPANCGQCGKACTAGANAAASCASGHCAEVCLPGYLDCDGDPANGCEVHPSDDAANCGGCGKACAAQANQTASCAAGQCGVTCDANHADCDQDPKNGCEVDTQTDAAHCGGCNTACTQAPANAVPTCTAGACGWACAPGFADCDKNPANGCEVDLTLPTSCGACNVTCASGPHSYPTCNSVGACGLECDPGYANCDVDPGNGCEVYLAGDVNNCGACGFVCQPPANATAACSGGCGIGQCNNGYADCDNSPADGCETNINTDAANCGSCNAVCALPNATPACASGKCAIAACNPGYADCDFTASNGCETNLNTDVSHCGSCATACTSTQTCSNGQCI